jgi:mono/diheme cytochrome c family protein
MVPFRLPACLTSTCSGRARRSSLLLLAAAACAHGAASPAAPSPRLDANTSAMVLLGDSLFNNNSCRKCHGVHGQAGQFAPDLTQGPWIHVSGEYQDLVRIITDGIPPAAIKDTVHHPYDMHPRGGSNFSDAQVRALAAYVWTISRHKTR